MNNFLNKYDLPITISLILLPIMSLVGVPLYVYYYGIVWQEIVLLFVGWFFAGTGITIGYHRLFAHRAFKTYPIVEWYFMICGSMALQNTIVKWCSDHRRHHKKLDTDEDPYSITKGFFHAHIGWILKKGDYNIDNVSDLEEKSAVKFQSKFYWTMAVMLSFILPLMIGLLYGRPLGGLLWGGILRVTLVHHFTFFINSLCHFLGSKNYDINTTAKDSWIMALLTFGEGYHNYHHKFQWDYRNGIKWYNFDPSKWIIKLLSYFKITHSLRKAPDHSILRAKVNTLYDKIISSSNLLKIDNAYTDKIKLIMENAKENLNLWKKLEAKYDLLKDSNQNSERYRNYEIKVSQYRQEINSSLNSLMKILSNMEKTT